MAITNGTRRGGNEYARIYDRLRKRSYRYVGRQIWPWFMNGGENSSLGDWYGIEHDAYVAGVRDALSLISAMQEDA